MIILGIDPGTRRVGYGVIKAEGGKMEMLSAGLLDIKKKGVSDALSEIKNGVDTLISEFRPTLAGIEKIRFAKNKKTATGVSEARGVIMLSFGEHGLPFFEFYPNEIKSAVCGWGLADKKMVKKMVCLTLKKPGLSLIDDATDALAIAIAAGVRKWN